MIKSKIFTNSIAIAAAQPAVQRTFPIEAPSDYKNVRGFYVIRNSGTDYFKIGIRDSAGNQILEPVNIGHLQIGNAVPIKDKFFKETPFKANGTKFIVTLENFAATTAV